MCDSESVHTTCLVSTSPHVLCDFWCSYVRRFSCPTTRGPYLSSCPSPPRRDYHPSSEGSSGLLTCLLLDRRHVRVTPGDGLSGSRPRPHPNLVQGITPLPRPGKSGRERSLPPRNYLRRGKSSPATDPCRTDTRSRRSLGLVYDSSRQPSPVQGHRRARLSRTEEVSSRSECH